MKWRQTQADFGRPQTCGLQFVFRLPEKVFEPDRVLHDLSAGPVRWQVDRYARAIGSIEKGANVCLREYGHDGLLGSLMSV
jgi:hypothetical protein